MKDALKYCLERPGEFVELELNFQEDTIYLRGDCNSRCVINSISKRKIKEFWRDAIANRSRLKIDLAGVRRLDTEFIQFFFKACRGLNVKIELLNYSPAMAREVNKWQQYQKYT